MDKTALRNASTVIVLRDRHDKPAVLMGQRGAKAAFMPNKFVFPGGAVDTGDATIPLAAPLTEPHLSRIREGAPDLAHALSVAAIRELWEETGQIIGRAGPWSEAPPADWTSYAATNHVPDASALQFVFRAITPPGRPRRFDARFFLIEADDLASDPDNFDSACDELSNLQWVPLSEARALDLPFITEVVLAEIAAMTHHDGPPESVPFFKNDDENNLMLRLGRAP